MADDDPLPPSDTRRFGRESDRKYLLLVIFTLVVVGGALIALIFGPQSLLTALPCLLGGAGLIMGLVLLVVPGLRAKLVSAIRHLMSRLGKNA